MGWADRVPPRPPRRSTNPYPIRFVAVCGLGDLSPIVGGAYDLSRAEGAASAHTALTGHEQVEVVRAEEVGL